ncbi:MULTISPECIES: hypothetical protein [Lonsdalea]|uniref:Uncharacterized protein n=2 Tax=Lonsdalea TaxID=1082702 RepID=A0ACD1JC75_9GAMM|nr:MULTISPECIES: hypothetical protein [Lonsdalea]OSN02623.1 hypothetical protein AU499_00510 [Lonsdalea populi]QPQ25619.1 hypothetical protein I6N93_07660 [Lonsdalea populi]RAT12813.1 hypothetical protein AU485_10600 [Lonsdalea quercina]RAT22244.1 hypothetical protein AU487_04300 [Lonsdalea populi]RAT24999.1 hypothetical protein AU488_06465 [Lonsdalea populi]
MKKNKRFRRIALIVLLLLIYFYRDALNPFKPDCSAKNPQASKLEACNKPIKEVAPGFEI